MNTLVLVSHPNLNESRLNRKLLEAIPEGVTVRDLYAIYPDGKIDAEKEQELLLSFDRIVFQFPFYWYSSPSLLKEWQDSVLTYGFAYGAEGTALRGKRFRLAVTTGGPSEAYQAEGHNRFTMDELFAPYKAMANLTGMEFEEPFLVQGAMRLTESELEAHMQAYGGLFVRSIVRK
ncbi:NAD(P)H-dependent oxidoreductase [Exiguobacterium flavidum]|uniref:NAD(P)H-dependent oxidoreductase n=1 Tax=Exiguobacterium flavidum TaxID=2184695 RepID=UPI000DF7BDCD|nr:NAD(P)H-dependent oxidoreductase [Exiguobacterium flavidum]